MNVFDIIGPVMIGPSSSHTAGAVRIGRVVNKLCDGHDPVKANITLSGSFAKFVIEPVSEALLKIGAKPTH